MKRVLMLVLIAFASSGVGGVGDVAAQPAGAIGHPLPRPELPAGTLTVRVIAGEMSAPEAEHDVRLTVDGVVRIAQTDASGRALFAGLKPGAIVKAATDGEGTEVTSDEFPMPEDTGVAVLLTTSELKGDAEGGGMAGGRPAPRMMAGQPRPEQADPPGDVTVRVTYNDLDSTEGIADRPVVMVKYAADGSVATKVIRTDAAGRAAFESLDTSGDSAYYAMTMLPRDGHTDRTMSMPIVPGTDVGIRVMLSGEKLKSGEPQVDDLTKFAREPDLPPGQVMVIFGGDTPDKGDVELHDATTGKVIDKAPIRQGRPIPSTITATIGEATPDAKTAAGSVTVHVVVAASGQELALPRTPVKLTGPADLAVDALRGETDDDGNVTIAGAPVGVPLQVTIDIQGKTFTGAAFTLAADQGVTIDAKSSFELLSLGEASFTGVAATPEGAYFAELEVKGKRYRSPPFQMAPERGVVVPIFVVEPRLQFAFSLDAFVDDDFLAARGQFILQNASFSPYEGPSEGLRIPAPAGATGLVLADESKPFAAVDGTGFRLLRAVPPMGGEFRAGFSVPIDHGHVHWDMALPLGTSQSSLAIRMTPTMKVDAPKAKGKQVKDPSSGYNWYAMEGIQIAANQRMVFDVSGLPQRPEWQHWARLFTGLAVLLLLAMGVVFAASTAATRTVAGGPGAVAGKKERRRRIEDLLDQVADLDRAAARGDAAANPAKRENLVVTLEQLYAEDDRG
jgi:hypothetical protein